MDDYTVSLPLQDALQLSHLLMNLGIALEGLVLTVEEAPDDPLLTITPRDIQAAHALLQRGMRNPIHRPSGQAESNRGSR